MSQRCAPFVQLLSARLDGALDGAHLGQLAEHLAACPSCRARELSLLAQGEALRAGSARRLAALEESGQLDLSGFAERVLRTAQARERAPSLWERLALSLRERWAHQRFALSASLGAALAGGMALAVFLAVPGRPLPGVRALRLAEQPAQPGQADPAPPRPAEQASVDEMELMAGTNGAVFQVPGQTTVIWLSDEAAE